MFYILSKPHYLSDQALSLIFSYNCPYVLYLYFVHRPLFALLSCAFGPPCQSLINPRLVLRPALSLAVLWFPILPRHPYRTPSSYQNLFIPRCHLDSWHYSTPNAYLCKRSVAYWTVAQCFRVIATWRVKSIMVDRWYIRPVIYVISQQYMYLVCCGHTRVEGLPCPSLFIFTSSSARPSSHYRDLIIWTLNVISWTMDARQRRFGVRLIISHFSYLLF